ncbi:MAG: ABC transporter ATP-binding protein [Telluria sp.]
MKTLQVTHLEAGYGPIQVLRAIDIAVEEASIVALLGANGAGKTTTLRALSGLIPATGRIELDGKDLMKMHASERVRCGIAHVPQGRGTFVDFTVEENLELGAYTIKSRKQIQEDIERWFNVFPRLKERRKQIAGSLSGGEQQMLAISRALMLRPRILMCDEPSLGLAPAITQELFAKLKELNTTQGMAILLVEQNADLSLTIADRAYVLEVGQIKLEGSAAELLKDPSVQSAYLGV